MWEGGLGVGAKVLRRFGDQFTDDSERSLFGHHRLALELQHPSGTLLKLEATPYLGQSFTNDPAGVFRAVDSPTVRTDTVPTKFYRVTSALGP